MIVVKENGHIVIPAGVRKQLGIRQGMVLEVEIRNGGIFMRPKRKISAKDLLGVAGKERANLEELESSLASE